MNSSGYKAMYLSFLLGIFCTMSPPQFATAAEPEDNKPSDSASQPATEKKFDQETSITLKDNSKFTVSPGWTYEPSLQKLISPEKDFWIYLLSVPNSGTPEELVKQAWHSVNHDISLKVLQASNPPSKDGWEDTHQIVYDVPTMENRSVAGILRVFKGQAYIMLMDGANGARDRRGAQIAVAFETWRPPGLKDEALGERKAKRFDEADAADFDQFIKRSMKTLDVPGSAVLVAQDGKVVYRRGFGVKKLGESDPVTPETIFMIGSMTKPLTTLMLSKLIEEGKLQWDTPINKALPSFALADKEVTAKFLIKHTACACTGMPRRDFEEIFGSNIKSVDDTVAQMHSMKPTTGFGEVFQYSNQLVAMGGLAGANVYGKGDNLFNKYENVMSDLVFTPLKMTATRVKPGESDAANLAYPHATKFDGNEGFLSQSFDDVIYTIGPAGCIWSNVDDIGKYMQMELRLGKDEDGKTLFSEDQINKRRTPGIKIDDHTRYGLGLFIQNDRGVKVIHHGGNTMGFTADMLFIPEQKIAFVSLTNAGHVNGFRSAMRQKLFEILFAAQPKADKMVESADQSFKKLQAKMRERVTTSEADVKWIEEFVGKYDSKELGPVEIKKVADGYQLVTPRWTSDLGTAREENGDKLLAVISPPWWFGTELAAYKSPRKLVLDDAQVKYEFTEVK